jgi:DNA-binding transcriptional MerR regulator
MGENDTGTAPLRIGEFCRRAGIAPERLRAWERRFGFPTPARTDGGFRLYDPRDVDAIVAVREAGERGISTAEAIAAVRARPLAPTATVGAHDWLELRAALDAMDGVRAHAEIDRLLATVTPRTFLGRILLPYLRETGERWAAGEHSIAHEHFASTLIRGRLLGLARSWDAGSGPTAVLACPAGEHHDLALIVFGILLRESGWRILYLGQDTPLDAVAQVAAAQPVALVVLAARGRHVYDGVEADLERIAAACDLALAGPGGDDALAAAVGAIYVDVDPVAAVDRFPVRGPQRRAI